MKTRMLFGVIALINSSIFGIEKKMEINNVSHTTCAVVYNDFNKTSYEIKPRSRDTRNLNFPPYVNGINSGVRILLYPKCNKQGNPINFTISLYGQNLVSSYEDEDYEPKSDFGGSVDSNYITIFDDHIGFTPIK